MKPLKEELAIVNKSGRITLGAKSVIDYLLTGDVRMVISSKNCPIDLADTLSYYTRLAQVSYQSIDVDSIELASICGKPYPVSVLAILDEGDSKILEVK